MKRSGLDFPRFWTHLDEDQGGPVPGWMRDRQERSRRTREAILEAAARLIQDRPYPEIGLQEVADEAGVSVGAVYARFPSKEAILTTLGVVVMHGACRTFGEAMEDLPSHPTLEAVVRRYVAVLVDELQRHRRIIMELRRSASDVPQIRDLLDRTNRAVHGAFIARASRCASEIRHTDPDRAIRWGLFLTNAGAREAVLSGALTTYRLRLRPNELKAELGRALIGYLRG